MSLANLIVQPQAAYLITDSGTYEPGTTRILALGQKVHWFSNRAIAFTAVGTRAGKPLNDELIRLDEQHRDDADWPDPLTDYLNVVKSVFTDLGFMGPEHASTFFVAGWSTAYSRAVGGMFHTRGGIEGRQPWTWYPADVAFNPYPEPVDVWGYDVAVDLRNPEFFDPHTDAMQIVEAQRRIVGDWGDGSVSGCAIAGEIHLTEVTANGVKIFDLHTYPDRVGELAGC